MEVLEEKITLLEKIIDNYRAELKDFKRMPAAEQQKEVELLRKIENKLAYLEEKKTVYLKALEDGRDINAPVKHYDIV